MKPRLLDAFCGGGGATKGYQMAGFHVTGVDIKPQPHYCGDIFIQGDALEYIEKHCKEYDVIHASPPCQAFTKARKLQGNNHPNLIEPLRNQLALLNKPWVIENVPGAPLINPFMLCGSMFGLMVYRHRLFESNIDFPFMMCSHDRKQTRLGQPPNEGEMIQVVGHFSNVPYARKAMGIDWMNQYELSQAIPPAYTEYIGKQILKSLTSPGSVL